jgi:hypothetical protein
MKKVSIVLNVILLYIIVLLACSKQGQRPKISTVAQAYSSQQVKCPCENYPYTAFTGVSASAAKEMSKKYRDENLSVLRETYHDSTSSIRFSLDALKLFIWKIEQQACNSGCTSKLYLHLYFAKYPNRTTLQTRAAEFGNALPRYANRQTIFIVPALANGTEITDYNVYGALGPDCNPPEFIFGNYTKQALIFTPGSELTEPYTTVKNHGDLIPPKTSRGSAF